MAANNKLVVSNLDFGGIKDSLVAFMQTATDENDQPVFTDYNFSASGLSTIMDLLAYNTHIQALMANFIANEMFLDTAAKRSSVISHAKTLGYTPRSVSSAKILATVAKPDPYATAYIGSTYVLPQNTVVTSAADNVRLMFCTIQNYVMAWVPNYNNTGLGRYVGTDIVFHEGILNQNTVTYSTASPYINILNTNVDTSTLRVWVQDDNSSPFVEYQLVNSFLAIASTSTCFFIQESSTGGFEIYFGDGVFGYRPKNGAVVRMTYVAANGAIANNINTLQAVSDSTLSITVQLAAGGGAPLESIESIKRKALNHYGTQNRAVIPSDYEAIISESGITNVMAVRVWGGEDDLPPSYNTIVICVEPNVGEYIVKSDEDQITALLTPKAVGNIKFKFKDPQYIDIAISNQVTYNSSSISISTYELESKVALAIQTYAATVETFSGVFRASNLISILDEADVSILSNAMRITLTKLIRVFTKQAMPIVFSFNNALTRDYFEPAFISSTFEISSFTGTVRFQDDRAGNINIVSADATTTVVSKNVGAVNYTSGEISISPVTIDALLDQSNIGQIKFTGKPVSQDVKTDKNFIIRIQPAQTTITSIPS